MNGMYLLVKRDLGRCFGKRFLLLLLFMVMFQVWFIIGSGSIEKVMEDGNYAFMGVVFSFNLLGSLAALALNFDTVLRERNGKVMDLLLTAGIPKTKVITAKLAATAISAMLFAALYILLVSFTFLLLGSGAEVFRITIRYILPVTGFIMVYNLIGILFSILFRSYRTSFIISMAVGLSMMPRILELFVKGAANAVGAGDAVIERIMMVSPAVMMNSITGLSGQNDLMAGMLVLAVYLVAGSAAIFSVFNRQDELSYNN